MGQCARRVSFILTSDIEKAVYSKNSSDRLSDGLQKVRQKEKQDIMFEGNRDERSMQRLSFHSQ